MDMVRGIAVPLESVWPAILEVRHPAVQGRFDRECGLSLLQLARRKDILNLLTTGASGGAHDGLCCSLSCSAEGLRRGNCLPGDAVRSTPSDSKRRARKERFQATDSATAGVRTVESRTVAPHTAPSLHTEFVAHHRAHRPWQRRVLSCCDHLVIFRRCCDANLGCSWGTVGRGKSYFLGEQISATHAEQEWRQHGQCGGATNGRPSAVSPEQVIRLWCIAVQLGEKVWKLQRPKSAYGKLEGHHRLTVNQANEVLVQMQASVLAVLLHPLAPLQS
eukprot:1488215-Rhodomonas_salina.2